RVGRRDHRGRNRRAEAGDRLEQLAPVADRGHADADQVFRGQLRQHLAVDVIVAERRDIALESQIPQPGRYVHVALLGLEKRPTPPSGSPQVALAKSGGGVHGAAHHSFTGVRMGAPLAFSSTTTNLAGSELLALRPTT